MKKKGNKTFMSISKKECLVASGECFANSNSKYNDAAILANAGSYGNATSMLMLSLEEMMKGLILNLDANGFKFRHSVKGIGSIFENHKLRYFLAFALSVFNAFSLDLKKLLIRLIDKPQEFLSLNLADPALQQRATLWLMIKMEFIRKDIEWFSNADMYRQDGFYVDFDESLKTPLHISADQFNEFRHRVDNFRGFASEFIATFDLKNNTPDLVAEIQKLQKRLIADGYYEKLGVLILRLNNRNFKAFDLLNESVSKVSAGIKLDLSQ